jgi:hypothetical protein
MRRGKAQISDQGEQQHEYGERSPVHISHGTLSSFLPFCPFVVF